MKRPGDQAGAVCQTRNRTCRPAGKLKLYVLRPVIRGAAGDAGVDGAPGERGARTPGAIWPSGTCRR